MSEKMTERDIGPYPYVGKTVAEVIHDYAVTRGDLVEQYARDQLVDIIERRIAGARREGATEAATAGYFRGYHDCRDGEQFRDPWRGHATEVAR